MSRNCAPDGEKRGEAPVLPDSRFKARPRPCKAKGGVAGIAPSRSPLPGANPQSEPKMSRVNSLSATSASSGSLRLAMMTSLSCLNAARSR